MAEEVKNKKQLLIRNSNGRSVYEVYYENGGEVPVDLLGVYTSHNQAQKAIDLYLTKKNRIVKNGSDTSK